MTVVLDDPGVPATAESQASAKPVTASSPEVEAAKEIAAAAAEVVRVAEARAAKAEHPARTAVVLGELDAVIQPLNNGSNHPSYKPSIVSHESGLNLGQLSLHCLAFNIGRALSLQRRSVVVLVLLARIHGVACRVIALGIAAV